MFGAVISMNRRVVFAGTFIFALLCGVMLHQWITGNTRITNPVEIMIILGIPLLCGYLAARRYSGDQQITNL
jgi:hypothetical protein